MPVSACFGSGAVGLSRFFSETGQTPEGRRGATDHRADRAACQSRCFASPLYANYACGDANTLGTGSAPVSSRCAIWLVLAGGLPQIRRRRTGTFGGSTYCIVQWSSGAGRGGTEIATFAGHRVCAWAEPINRDSGDQHISGLSTCSYDG